MGAILEVIKRGFVAASKNMGLVLVLIVFNLAGNMASLPFSGTTPATVTPQINVAALIFSAIFILISIFVQGGTLGLVRDFVKEGGMKLAAFVSYGMKYYLRLLGLGLLIVLIIAVVALIAGLIIAVTAPLNNTVVTAIATAIAIAIGVIALLAYFIPFTLAPYALITEELGVIAAMKRSLAVARKPFAKVFSLLLLFVLLILIALGVGFVAGFVVGLINAFMPAAVQRILMAVVAGIINGYLGVVMTASFMVYYLSLAKTEKA